MLSARPLAVVVRATAQPHTKKKIKPRDVEHAIEHAKLICFNFEDAPECRVAWDHVEEISAAYHDQTVRDADDVRRIELSRREYDL